MFVILFASQTIAAVYDAHAPHQVSSSHNSNIEHTSHQEVAASLDDSSSPDCHHCCHCHTPSSVAVLLTDSESLFAFDIEKLLVGNLSADSTSISPEHRPPIA
jgi:hypothetical protein